MPNMKPATRVETTDLLSLPAIRAFSTQRDCTDPYAPYCGFSTCHYTADNSENVAACRATLARELGIDSCRLIIPRQTHSANVRVIDENFGGNDTLDDTDAIVTALPDTALVIHTADCVPIVMVDPKAGVIAAAHSGWRGTVQNIAGLTIEAMVRLGAEPRNIVAAMGPSICMDCFEVGQEVADRFEPGFVSNAYGEKPHIALSGIIASQLEQCGLRKENIKASEECSRCKHEKYFSARRLGVNSGRTATVIIRYSRA